MKQLFERTSSYWVRYDKYEIRTDAKGVQYVTAAPGARPQIIDPLEDAQAMMLDALNETGDIFFAGLAEAFLGRMRNDMTFRGGRHADLLNNPDYKAVLDKYNQ